jgi:hypothetical protein
MASLNARSSTGSGILGSSPPASLDRGAKRFYDRLRFDDALDSREYTVSAAPKAFCEAI